MKSLRSFFAFLPCLWLAACAGGGGSPAGTTADAASPAATQGFRMRSGELGDDDFDKIASKFGTKYTHGQQSEKFKHENAEFKGNWKGKEFDKKPFEKKSFWGDREYAKKVYGGDTDGSRFAKNSRFGGQGAREAGTTARDAGKSYATNDFKTATAREAGRKEIERNPKAEADARRKVFPDQEIIDWRDQRALTLEQTRRMLGRE